MTQKIHNTGRAITWWGRGSLVLFFPIIRTTYDGGLNTGMRRCRRRQAEFRVTKSAVLMCGALVLVATHRVNSASLTPVANLLQTLKQELIIGPAEAGQGRGRGGRNQSGGQTSIGNWETNTRRTSASSGSSRTDRISNGGSSSSRRYTSSPSSRADNDGEGSSPGRSDNHADSDNAQDNSGSIEDGSDSDDGNNRPASTLAGMLGLENQNRRRGAALNGSDSSKPHFPRRNDVLVRNISDVSRTRLEANGFKVEKTKDLKSDGQTIARVVPPSKMNGAQALDMIVKLAPDTSAFANESYRIITPTPADGAANGTAPEANNRKPDLNPQSGPRTGQCRDDRCFGRLAIGWHSDLAECSRKVKIGVIDTPVDLEHPALKNQKISVGNFLGGTQRSGKEWHGTAVLSLLSGQPDSGVPGLAPNAEYYVAEAFQSDSAGDSSSSTLHLLEALEWLDRFGVRLVNLSFSGPRDALVEHAISRMQAKGVLFVAAAGNFGPTAPESYPAAYKNVIAVTAITKDLSNYRNANRGSYVDLSAPGVNIWTALPGGREGFRTGTSFAAPYVTGIIAANLAGQTSRPKNKSAVLSQLSIRDLGPVGPDQIFGRGLAMAPKQCGGRSVPVASSNPPTAVASEPSLSFGTMTVTPATPSFTAGSAASGLGFAD